MENITVRFRPANHAENTAEYSLDTRVEKCSRLDAPIVCLVHGAGGCKQQWDEQIAALREIAHVIAPDLLGHGASSKPRTSECGPEAYSTAGFVAQLAAVLAQIIPTQTATPARLVFIGHSYGCALVLQLLEKGIPAELAQIVGIALLAPPVSLLGVAVDPQLRQRIARVAQTPTWVMDLWRLWDRWGGAYSRSVSRYVAPSASLAVRERQLAWNRANPTFMVQAVLRGMAPVPAISPVPTVILAGQEDKVAPLAGITQFCDSFNPSGLHVISNAGHSLMVEQPDQVAAILRNFIRGLQ